MTNALVVADRTPEWRKLKALVLDSVSSPAIGANFVSLAEQAVKENQSRILYLEALLALECEERDSHAIENRTRDAQVKQKLRTLKARSVTTLQQALDEALATLTPENAANYFRHCGYPL